MKKVLITGVNGFVGQHIVRKLSECDGFYHLFGIDMHETFMPFNFNKEVNVDYNRLNLTDASAVDMLIRCIQPEVVIHLAALTGDRANHDGHKRMLDVNVNGTVTILQALSGLSTHLIFPSTGLIYGGKHPPYTEDMPPCPANFYALTKKMGEEAIDFFVRTQAVRATILRPSVIYGPGQNCGMFIPSIIKSLLVKQEFPMTSGEQKRDFVYAPDVADAFVAAIRSGITGVFNIASGTSITMLEAAKTIAVLCGANRLIKPGEIPYRQNESWNYALGIQKIQKQLQWLPQTSFEKGIQEVVSYEKLHV